MKYDEFIARWLGKSIDFDGAYGPQCVDLVAQYCVENGKPVAYANAKDWANHPALREAFTWTDNNPNDYNQIPKRGDIIVWSGNLPGSGGYGHIAIWDMVKAPGVFQSLDQNWGGQTVHFVTNHTWDYILGWWTPKATATPVTPPQPAPDPSTAQIADLKTKLDAANAQVSDLTNKLNGANLAIADLNKKVDDLTKALTVREQELSDLRGKFASAQYDSVQLNALGQALQWIVKRLGLK